MIKPTYDVQNADQLNKFLVGVLRDLRKGELSPEIAEAISKVADKVNKNNINQILYKKLTHHSKEIPFFTDGQVEALSNGLPPTLKAGASPKDE